MSDLDHLRALRAFEAAARNLSYVSAARELSVTPAAVGQHVKGLEAWLGVRLFRRSKAGAARLALTEEARAALPTLSAGFDQIAGAVQQLRRDRTRQAVTVAVTPAFATHWLLPRLDRFRAMHPDTDLRLNISDAHADYTRTGIEVGVRFGAGQWTGLTAALMRKEHVIPVCSPGLVGGAMPLRALEDLRRQTLIQDTTVPPGAGMPDWRSWLAAAGCAGLDPAGEMHVNASAAAIQAAAAGQGVALARALLVADDIAAGRLVCPFNVPAWPLRWAWFVVHPVSRLLPEAAGFHRWLLAQTGGSSETTWM